MEVAGRLSETASKWVDATLLAGASTDRPQTALSCGSGFRSEPRMPMENSRGFSIDAAGGIVNRESLRFQAAINGGQPGLPKRGSR